MLFGGGFFGGLGGIASFLGLMLQIGLVVLLASFAMRWFRNRQQPIPAYARAQPGQGGPVPPVGGGMGGPSSGLGGLGGGLGGALGGMGLGRASGGARIQDAPARKPGVRDEIGIGEADYAAFERSLVEVQGAYSRQDVEALWDLATPEMAGYIQEELNEATQKGVVNTATDVRLLQGDLSEAWREGNVDYATVAMRFSAIETTTEKATGRIVEGDPAKPSEVAELWTFRRDAGGSWKLSAIQQA
jgi:predicted lipid-binding transport protein (Tim44 family)